MELPDDLKEMLDESHYAAVVGWWESLSLQQQHEYSDVAKIGAEAFELLEEIEEIEPDDPRRPYYDYLVNHELRLVNFIDDIHARSSYKIMTAYVATLGSDYRHGQSGTVR